MTFTNSGHTASNQFFYDGQADLRRRQLLFRHEMPTSILSFFRCTRFVLISLRSTPLASQALDGNVVKILYLIKCQSILYLSVKFQVVDLEISKLLFIPLRYHNNKTARHYAILILCLCFGAVFFSFITSISG